MTKVKASKMSSEEEITTLKRHFGGIVATIRDLKRNVEALEKKISLKENEEISEIMETQKVIEEVIVANADAMSIFANWEMWKE